MLERFRKLARKPPEAGTESLESTSEPHPAVAIAVGLIYVFRTAAGSRLMQELETAVRTYSANPQALWRLVKSGEDPGQTEKKQNEVIEGSLAETKALP